MYAQSTTIRAPLGTMSKMRAIIDDLCHRAGAMGFKVQKGLKVIEFFSDARWNKGQAVRWLMRRLRAGRVFYAGDDVTDETVFRLLGRQDVGVRIGKKSHSRASYYVNGQKEAPAILERIIST